MSIPVPFRAAAGALAAAALSLALALPGAALAQREAPKAPPPGGSDIFDLPYTMTTLDNGLRVIIVPTDTPGVVSLQIPVQTGSRNEVEQGKSGFAHFFEHMMFRGTPNYSADEYGAVIKAAGADQNAYTTDDFTNYYTTFTTADLEKILEVEGDRFQNLSYSEAQFRTEALAVKGEYLKNYSNPLLKGFERLYDISFDVHPYEHTTMGYLEDIEDMPNQLEYSKQFFDRWYRPENTSLIIVGDVEPKATLAMVEKYWGDWERGSYRAEIPAEPDFEGPAYEHLAFDGPTLPYLLVGFRAPAVVPTEKDIPALMLAQALYFGETSELYQTLVVRERWADQFFAEAPLNKDPNLFVIGVRLTDPAHAPKVVAAIQDTLLRARTELLDPQQLSDAKSRMRYSFASAMDSASSIAGVLARFVQFARTPETLNELYRSFDAVTAEDVRNVANQVFADRHRSTVSIANADALAGASEWRALDAEVAKASQATLPDIDVVEQHSNSPLVDVALLFETGAAHDPAGKKGLAWLTASMLTEGGTERRGIEEIEAAFYPMAAGFGAQVDKEMVKLSGQVHRENLDAWYAIVREMLLSPGFREEDLARLKQQQANAIRVSLRGNNDEEFGKEALYEQVYGAGHPYGTLNMGHAKDVEALTMDDVRAFYQANFVPARVTVGLAGDYPESFRDTLLRDLASLGEGARQPVKAPVVPRNEHREALVIQKETPAVAVSFGWPIALKRGDPDWVALWLVRSWLGEHRNSSARLYNVIREARGMNYGDYAYIEYFPYGMYRMQPAPNYARDHDLFQIWIRPLRTNNDALFATRAALYELDKLVENGMTQAEFEGSRDFLQKFVAILTAAQDQRLGYALDSDWFGIGPFVDYVRDGLARLTLADVNRVIRKYIHTDAAEFVFISKDAEGLAQALAAGTPSPMEYNSEKPAELLAEDEVIEDYPLGLSADTVKVVPADTLFE